MPYLPPVPMTAVPVQLGVAVTTLHTVPVNRRDTVVALILKNTAANARTVTVYHVPSGGSASATNMVCEATIPANSQRLIWELVGQAMAAGDFLQALSDAASAVSARGSVLPGTP